MFEFKRMITQPIYRLNYIMPCLITAPMRSDLKRLRDKKEPKKLAKTKTSRQKLKI